jgi:hypothetical protein
MYARSDNALKRNAEIDLCEAITSHSQAAPATGSCLC